MPKTILVVDDQPSVRQLLQEYLSEQGFSVLTASDGQAAIYSARHSQPDLILLDIMMPKVDGYQFLRQYRLERKTPVIIITAREEETDAVLGLELGADDYLTKPFNPRELVARVKAILRRGEHLSQTEAGAPIHLGDLTVDPSRREVLLGSRRLDLRTQEFDLLLTLAEHRGRVLSREQILEKAWGFDFYGQTRTVDVHVAHLRKKIEESRTRIETVTGVGYKLVVPP